MRNKTRLGYLLLIFAPIILSSCLQEKQNNYEKYLACLDKGANAEFKIHQKYCFDKYSTVSYGANLVSGFGNETFDKWSNKNTYRMRNTSGKILSVKTVQIWLKEKDKEDGVYLSYLLNCEHKLLPAEETEVACFFDGVTQELRDAFNEKYNELEKSGKREGGWAPNDVAILKTN